MSGQCARTQAKPSSRPLVEGRRDHVDVGQMAAAEVGVVVDEHIARLERGRRLDHRLDRQRHRAEMDRQVRSLRHHLAAHVEEPARVVAGHLEQRRVRGLGQHDLHLLGRAVERVLDDLERRGIGLTHAHAPATIRPPGVDPEPPAGRHDDRGVGSLDDRGPERRAPGARLSRATTSQGASPRFLEIHRAGSPAARPPSSPARAPDRAAPGGPAPRRED